MRGSGQPCIERPLSRPTEAAQGRGVVRSVRLQIVRRGFAGAPIGDDLVGGLLAFIPAAQAGPFDRADMDEHVDTASIGLNEPEPFVALNHFTVPVAMARSSRISGQT